MTTEQNEKAGERMIKVDFQMAFPYLAQIHPILHFRERTHSMNVPQQCKTSTSICNWNNEVFLMTTQKKVTGEYIIKTCKWHTSFLTAVKNSLVSRCHTILTNSPVKDCQRPICQCNQHYSFDMSGEKGGTTTHSVRPLCSEGSFKARFLIFHHGFYSHISPSVLISTI